MDERDENNVREVTTLADWEHDDEMSRPKRKTVEWNDNSNQVPPVRARLLVDYGDDGISPACEGDLVLAGFIRVDDLAILRSRIAKLEAVVEAQAKVIAEADKVPDCCDYHEGYRAAKAELERVKG